MGFNSGFKGLSPLYKYHSVNAVKGNEFLYSESYKTYKYTLWKIVSEHYMRKYMY